MENPVKELIEQTGLTLKEFAVTHGCLFTTLRNCIYGNTDRVPKSIIKALLNAGIDTDGLNTLYKEWLVDKFKKEEISYGKSE